MSTIYHNQIDSLEQSPRRWLVTGAAGFIGSNLVLKLLSHGQTVVGLDNFSTGFQQNLDEVRDLVGPTAWSRFTFIEGDIRHPDVCTHACESIDFVLHQAALGSVPRSLADPIRTNDSNVTGFLNMLVAARDSSASRFVYAASSSTYGDHPAQPRREDTIGSPLSPYAVSKLVNELYADVFRRSYAMDVVGLRYFNVFGPRQNPDGAYAAVIPRWIRQMVNDEKVVINGDGKTTRDFCFVENTIQANILAATLDTALDHPVYNIALNQATSLNELFEILRDSVTQHVPSARIAAPQYQDFRAGDVPHSLADIARAEASLSYSPQFMLKDGLESCMPWYLKSLIAERPAYRTAAR